MLEFNSSRKRMSVIVSNEDGEIFLLCKGADEYVFLDSFYSNIVYLQNFHLLMILVLLGFVSVLCLIG